MTTERPSDDLLMASFSDLCNIRPRKAPGRVQTVVHYITRSICNRAHFLGVHCGQFSVTEHPCTPILAVWPMNRSRRPEAENGC
jgi:hypothetical protein